MALLLTMMASQLAAQSISGGALDGRVVDALGTPIFDAEVTLVAQSSGALYITTSSRSGFATLSALPPGDYDVRAEALGYRPRLVRGVPVRPGAPTRVTVVLEAEAPPVTQVDTVTFSGGAAAWIRPGEGRWLSRLELKDLPDHGRTVSDLGRLSSGVGPGNSSFGLPPRFTRFYLDGLAVETARLPGTLFDPLAALSVPRSGLSGAELIAGDTDVEWVDWGGAILAGLSRAAGDRNEVDLFADYSGGGLFSSQAISGTVPTNQSVRGGVTLSVPIVRDTTRLMIGVEGWRVERPEPARLPGGWAGAPVGLDDALLRTAQAMTGFARLDWALRGGNRFQIRANFATLADPAPEQIGLPVVPGQLGATKGTDLSVALSVFTNIARNWDLEARVGLETSNRVGLASPGLDGTPFPGTTLASVGIPIGTANALPTDVTRSAISLAPTIHYDLDEHQLKFGARFVAPRYQYEGVSDQTGSFRFGNPNELSAGRGYYHALTGSALDSEFSLLRVTAFGQDRWNVTPDLEINFGAQYAIERLPEQQWNTSLVWDSLTGMGADSVDNAVGLTTRFGFRWSVGGSDRTTLRGQVGLSYASLDPADIHTLLVGDGRATTRLATTGLNTWPSAPSTAAVNGAPRIALLGPDLNLPRTARASFGLSRALAAGVAIHAGGSFRRTETIQRIADLNLNLETGGVDQFGRPLFGPLVNSGGLLFSQPTRNRRFPTIERAEVVNSDGWSQQSAVTLAIERHGTNGDFFASYTYSKTEDNLVGASQGTYDATLDPGLRVGSDPWSAGLSDFDVPHRFVAGLGLPIPVLEGGVLGVLYRFQSGDAFTPGFRMGVDANGDGAAGNDPAYSGGPSTPGLTTFNCEEPPAGDPYARNSCRGPSVQSLDLSLRLGAYPIGNRVAEITVDVLNVIEPELGYRDTALYLVDGTSALTRSGNETVVPLQANDNFGEMLYRTDPGRVIRVGLRIGGGR